MTGDVEGPARGALIGRYALHGAIASGGMATVHLGRLLGPVGFTRTVAIKRLHRQFAKDPGFLAMFLDEARLASKVRHPNVVSILDVVASDGELFLVMDYVEGESLARLLKRARGQGEALPVPIASSIVLGMLYGLHAAHEAKNDRGEALGIVHRDVSPQNVLVGIDGVSRVADFGVAKAARRIQETEVGHLKGKIAYMAPEQVALGDVDRRADVFVAGVVLWETLTRERLFQGENAFEIVAQIKTSPLAPPSRKNSGVSAELDAVVLRALERDPDARYATCRDMAIALEGAAPPAVQRIVGEWVERLAGDTLGKRAVLLSELETQERSAMGDPEALARVLDPSANHSATSLLGEALSPPEPATSTLTTPVASPITRSRPPLSRGSENDSSSTKATWDASPTRQRPRAALLGMVIGALAFGGSLAVVLGVRYLGAQTNMALARGLGWATHLPKVPPPPVLEPAVSAADALPVAPEVPATRATPRYAAPKAKLAPDCNPPYIKGADGITRFKKECLKK